MSRKGTGTFFRRGSNGRSALSASEGARGGPKKGICPRFTVAACGLALLTGALTSPTVAARRRRPPTPPDSQRWWNKDWPYRAELRFSGWPGTTGAGSVWLHGRSTDDLRDLRVVDADGKCVNFRILRRDRPCDIVTLRVHLPTPGAQRLWLYFGNKSAKKIDTAKVNSSDRLWERRSGVLLWTYRKAKPGRPKTLADLKKMIRAAGEPQGVGLLTEMSCGSNPYGESDGYISVMEGYLHIDKLGSYGFRVFGDDGCWVLIDGKEMLAWPGPRTRSDWGRGEWRHPPRKDFTIELSKGAHRVEFFHEEGADLQIAALGWKPPWPWLDGKGRPRIIKGKPYHGFRSIPKSVWGERRILRVGEYQHRDEPLIAAPVVWLSHTFWIPDTAQQIAYACLDNHSKSKTGKIVKLRWVTDDGMARVHEGEPARMEHIFFSNGRRRATVTISDDKGNSATASCVLPIWQINVGRTARGRFDKLKGQQSLYLGLLDRGPPYDVAKLTHDDLVGYAVFWYTFDKDPEASAALARLVKERPDHRRLGDLAVKYHQAALRGGFDADTALRLIDIAAKGATDPSLKRELLMRRAYALAWGKGDYKGAIEIYDRICAKHPDSAGYTERRFARRALIAKGDVFLLQAEYKQAEKIYRQAEKIDPRKMTRAAKLARIGGYPYRVEDYLERDLHNLALKTLDEWEDLMPITKLKGLTFCLRGKVMYLGRPSPAAVRYLDLAERVSPKALHVPEALWLKANCLMDTGEYKRAIVEFGRIRDEFTDSEYLKRIPARIKRCKAKLDEQAKARSLSEAKGS